MPRHTDLPHGTNAGYKRGCRKECCRSAHREAMREYRAAKASAALAAAEPEVDVVKPLTPPRADLPDLEMGEGAGIIERAFLAELNLEGSIAPYKATLAAMMLFNARVLDQTRVHERYDIISGVESRTLEILGRLNAITIPGGEEGATTGDDGLSPAVKELLASFQQPDA